MDSKWRESTRATTEQIINTHILAELGDTAVSTIIRAELQALLARKAAAGLSRSVVGHILWQLVAILRMAKADRIITENVADGLVMPKCSGTVDRRVIGLKDIERGHLVLPTRERLIFRFAVCDGMRPSEIMGLQLGDFDGTEIHIRRRIYRGKEGEPKTDPSKRDYPLTEGTRNLIAEYITMLRDTRPKAWLFPSENENRPLSYSNVWRRRIEPALKSIGLGSANFQILRRTWVTEFNKEVQDPKASATIAGHGVAVDQRVYRQSTRSELKRAVQKWEKRVPDWSPGRTIQ